MAVLRHAAPSTNPKNSSSHRYRLKRSHRSSNLPKSSDTRKENAAANRIAAIFKKAVCGATASDLRSGRTDGDAVLSNPMECSNTPRSSPLGCRQGGSMSTETSTARSEEHTSELQSH